MQLTFINQRANMQDFVHSIEIPARGDEYDGIRREYADMLKNQLQKEMCIRDRVKHWKKTRIIRFTGLTI